MLTGVLRHPTFLFVHARTIPGCVLLFSTTAVHEYGVFGDAEQLNASASGTSVSAGLEHSVSNKTKFVGDLGYDIEFEGIRVGGGALWGWDSFRLKLGVQYFAPKGYKGLVLPYIGLWWRFDG